MTQRTQLPVEVKARESRIWCMNCGKSVSTPVPEETLVRAWVECPECIEAGHKPPNEEVPEVSMQQLIDVGFNAFGLQLFAESVAGKTDAKTFNPLSFIFRNIKITLEPHGEVDTSHH